MNEILLYILKVNIVLSLCFLLYWVLLRNEKFFVLNRFFLLGAIAFAFLLPILPGTLLQHLNEKIVPAIHEPLSEVGWLQTPPEPETYQATGEQTTLQTTEHSTLASRFTSLEITTIIYCIISFGFFIRFLVQLVQLSRLLKGNETKKIDGIIYHITEKPLPPFSFFHHLIINKTQSEKELEQIITHEKVHIKQWHIIDILLAQLIQAAFWINPLVWMMNRMIRLNLEYIADEEVLKSGVDRKAYQVNILTACLNPAEFELANLFSSSKIKLRIQMMNTKNTPLSHLYKYALILPFLLVSYFLINPVSAQTTTLDRSTAVDGVYSSGMDQQSSTSSDDESSDAEDDATPLIRAALKGNLERVKQLVDKGADVNESVLGDGSPLIAAAGNGHEQIVLFLIEKGAAINKAVPGDGNPLIAAAKNGYARIVSFLIEKGAEVNAIVPGDETALINAAGRGHLDIVKYLVAKGADVNLAVMANGELDPELRSPLNQAIKYGHRAVASYLREKGAKN